MTEEIRILKEKLLTRAGDIARTLIEYNEQIFEMQEEIELLKKKLQKQTSHTSQARGEAWNLRRKIPKKKRKLFPWEQK